MKHKVVRLDIVESTKGKAFKNPIAIEQYKISNLIVRDETVRKGQRCIVEKAHYGTWEFSHYFRPVPGMKLDTAEGRAIVKKGIVPEAPEPVAPVKNELPIKQPGEEGAKRDLPAPTEPKNAVKPIEPPANEPEPNDD
jgi:hypothetical protein